MSATTIALLGVLCAVGLLGYLLYTLVRPERF